MNAIRTSLRHAPSEPASEEQLRAMARAAWKRKVLVVWLDDLTDDFDRQWAINLGTKLHGNRSSQ